MTDILGQMREWLTSEGYEQGCHGVCGHTCGLPPGVLVKPGYSPVDGAYTIVVTTTEVMSATCMYPSNHNDWRIRRRIAYTSRDELSRHLRELTVQPRGCWQ